ncbi:MAG TPA: S8 family serine peptidase [Allosphingosinicella sp.]|nr:S8 family serine peptidase [Allosphingosinicella sp.]
MADRKTKQRVEAILYGTGNQRRFTHDSPIQLDVWAQYYEDPGRPLELLIVPWADVSPVDVVESLRDSMQDRLANETRISYNRRVLAASMSLATIVDHVLPIMGWYARIKMSEPPPVVPVEGGPAPVEPSAPDATAEQKPFPIALPDAEHLWDDIDATNMTAAVGRMRQGAARGDCYPYPQLLSFVRLAGLIFDMQAHSGNADRASLERILEDFACEDDKAFTKARLELTRRILRGWKASSRTALPAPVPPAAALVHSITRNRPARLAIYQSVRTVKGDAAHSLFSVNCSALTWAIMDSGIDAAHPAFRRYPEQPLPDNPTMAQLMERSRVKETYDFAYLRELLLDPENPDLPPHVVRTVGAAGASDPARVANTKRRELLRRISRSRSIDWDLLRPFLRVDHGDAYLRPLDTHGTHVAGILGAKWREPGAENPWMAGMCPDINFIDIRVCRLDGSSDEFVIMSALQFIRHLNASSDRMAIHGINMSLSLDHDAAVYACGRTPICEEAERTVANGVVVVAAAGNLGYRRVLDDSELPFDQFCPVSITDPGNAENVITVGATHRMEPHNYGVSYFSSRGPTGDGRIKPDLVAPGEKIYAPALGDSAVRLDGTSMAAPHVSGAAAMLMARHVELIGEPQRVKAILCNTATDLGREPYFQGRGLVDVLRAIQSV